MEGRGRLGDSGLLSQEGERWHDVSCLGRLVPKKGLCVYFLCFWFACMHALMHVCSVCCMSMCVYIFLHVCEYTGKGRNMCM